MSETKLIAFHGDPAIKTKYLARVRAHRLADDIRHGYYWENGRGCAVGCTIHGSSHAAYETELGIPRVLARLEDRIFEGTGNSFAQEWPEKFLDAIPVGADLSNAWPEFALWMLADDTYGVVRYARTEAQRVAILSVAHLYAAQLAGLDVSVEDWREARAAADAAADAAAYAAAYAAADAAAYAAAYAYAYAAAAADAYADARREFYTAAGNKLLELMASAHV